MITSKLKLRHGYLAISIMLLTILAILPESSCGQLCGDINGDQSITVLDITYFISYQYKNGPVPENLALCDVNNSGGLNILDILYLLSFLYKQGPAPYCAYSGPHGGLISNTGCKPYFKGPGAKAADDCLQWEYINGYTRRVTHQNGCFNCCANIGAEFYMSNDTIIITESESFGEYGPCPCLCLFDVEYEFDAIPSGVYFIKINGLNIQMGDSLLSRTINLDENPTGSFCLPRDYYPWDMYEQPPSGSLLSHSNCLTKMAADTVLEEDCIIYRYSSDSVLSLTHHNSLFNCCPDSLYASVEIQSNVINIIENESLAGTGGCDCICIYNLYYGIFMIPPGLWTIRVDNPFYYGLYGDGKIIEFEVDLSAGISGSFCVDRDYLPWSQ